MVRIFDTQDILDMLDDGYSMEDIVQEFNVAVESTKTELQKQKVQKEEKMKAQKVSDAAQIAALMNHFLKTYYDEFYKTHDIFTSDSVISVIDEATQKASRFASLMYGLGEKLNGLASSDLFGVSNLLKDLASSADTVQEKEEKEGGHTCSCGKQSCDTHKCDKDEPITEFLRKNGLL